MYIVFKAKQKLFIGFFKTIVKKTTKKTAVGCFGGGLGMRLVLPASFLAERQNADHNAFAPLVAAQDWGSAKRSFAKDEVF